MLRNPYESPQKAAEDTSGRRGVVKYTKKTHSNYKAKQGTLIAYLKCFFGNNKTTCDSHSSTEEFCDYIDQYTLNIIKLLVDGLTSVKLEILSMMLDLCEHVVMGRIVVDWAQPNNLITTSGWDNWRKHISVLISFAAMLTTLFMVLSTLKGSHALVTYSSCCIGIFPVVVATDFVHRNCYISCNPSIPTGTSFPEKLFLRTILIFKMSFITFFKISEPFHLNPTAPQAVLVHKTFKI